MDETLSRDQNHITVLGGITDDSNQYVTMLRVDPVSKRLLVSVTGVGTGTVTSVSVVSANGFAGTVATATTTPAITLTTTITGLIKGNGTALSAASAGTDYVVPGPITTSGLTMATAKILGRATAATGAIEEIAVTGTGSVVLATSPTLVTPNLGTPTTLVGTNITGTAAGLTAGMVTTNANLTGAVTSSGNATSLGSFSSANLASALTDETGTGANVFAGSPTFTGKPVVNNFDNTGATYTPSSGSQTVAIDCASNNMHMVTGNASGTAITFTIANATNNQPFIISILQGSGTLSTISGWFATVRWASGSTPTLTATLNKRDTFGFIRTGSNTYDGFIVGQNC